MWIVYYMTTCELTGREYLAHFKFDNAEDAQEFADEVDGTIETRPVFV